MLLFEDEWGEDNSPVDNTEIRTTLLYYSKEELEEFKKLCKVALQKEFPDTYKEDGNVSDLLLKILRDKYANL